MYIRWMGAFKKNGSLFESVQFECSRTTDIACEKLINGKSLIKQARVGLLINPSAVYARYNGDVFSDYDADGNLFPTRKGYEAHSKHKECFAHPVYTGIVIKDGGIENLKNGGKEQVLKCHQELDLPIYKLVKGKLIKII